MATVRARHRPGFLIVFSGGLIAVNAGRTRHSIHSLPATAEARGDGHEDERGDRLVLLLQGQSR